MTVAAVVVGSLSAVAGRETQSAGAPTARAVLDRYCVTCHSTKLRTAGLALDAVDAENVADNAATWEKVVAKLRSGAMPPAGRPRPDKATSEAIASSLEASLDRAATLNLNPGRAAIHRLNRAEYTNAIRDLLAIEVDGRSLLPPDDSGYGFDNVADVLSVSPALLERYMIAAGKVSRTAIGDSSIRPFIQTYRVRPTLLQSDRMSEQLPFGTRGGLAVRHYFPLDGEYLVKLRLQRTHANSIRGLGEPNDIEVRLDGSRVGTFKVGGAGPRDPWSAVPSASLYEQTADDGLELHLAVKAGMRQVSVAFPKKSGLPEGVLEPRLSVSTYEFAGDRDVPMSLDHIQISGPYEPSGPVDTPSRRRIFVCHPETSGGTAPQPTPDAESLRSRPRERVAGQASGGGAPREVKNEDMCARKILATLARRAYRRPITSADLDPLLGYYRTGRASGTFDTGIELALRALLVDPDFLFRIERDPASLPPGAAYRLSDLELASRLSFFLWSSIPDDELLALGASGQLKDPDVLGRQVGRMLRDPRSSALVTNFAGQWLYLRNLPTIAPDPDTFPDFDDNLREALRRETELFVESQLREDRSVVDLLGADYTFVNDRLARHYRIPGIRGSYFRRVTLTDRTRAGLLGQGSILTVTSYANRTSPTLRGKWMLENLLGAPPPAPPPNVPDLAEAALGKPTSVRQRMEAHRSNPVCASCHAQMDPLGLALENFDAIGRWRSSEGGGPIDASASLPDGSRFDGPSGLRAWLMERRERFAATLTEKLLTYALGRGVEYYDAPAIRQILRDAAANDYRWSSIIQGVVQSVPFQMRKKLANGRVGELAN